MAWQTQLQTRYRTDFQVITRPRVLPQREFDILLGLKFTRCEPLIA